MNDDKYNWKPEVDDAEIMSYDNHRKHQRAEEYKEKMIQHFDRRRRQSPRDAGDLLNAADVMEYIAGYVAIFAIIIGVWALLL